jgi:hypothetical protein
VGSGDFNFKSGVIKVESLQTIYNAQALDSFTGSLVIGDGGTNLSHTTGDEGYYNTFVGLQAGSACTTGYSITAMGYLAGAAITTGKENTLVGSLAGSSIINSSGHVAVGFNALASETAGIGNTAVGYGTLATGTDLRYNVAVGYGAIATPAASTKNNVAVGTNSLPSIDGRDNVAIGHQAMQYSTTGNYNVCIGSGAGWFAQGSRNFAIGQYSLYLTDAVDGWNIGIGYQALNGVTSGTYNTGIGYNVGEGITTGSNNTIIGRTLSPHAAGLTGYVILLDGLGNQRIYFDASGHGYIPADNTKLFLGIAASCSVYYDAADMVFDSQEAGSGNFNFKSGLIEVEGIQTIYHAQALDSFTGSLVIGDGGTNLSHTAGDEGYYNTFIGIGAARDTTTGAFNVALGAYTLDKINSGDNNTALGYHTLRNTTIGNNNTGVGCEAVWTNTEGLRNTGVGYQTAYSNTLGLNNTAIGVQALYTNSTSDSNSALGYRALYSTTGEANLGCGAFALFDNAGGTYNVAVGYNTGRGITTGNYNTIIGSQVTGLAAGLSNYVIIADGQGNQRIIVNNSGDAEINGDLKISGKFSSGVTTISVTGPTNNVDVADCNIVFLNTASNNVTIGGFINGVVGQVIQVVRLDSSNNATLEHNEGTGNQDIFLAKEADQTISTYGGWKLVCNGTHWYEVGYTPETTTVSAVGPTDNVDVTACNTVFLDTSSNTVTVGGFTNGVKGQVIRVVKLDDSFDATLEHAESGGSQDIFLALGRDHVVSGYGGWTLVCDGSDWYEVSHEPCLHETVTISATGPTDSIDVSDCKILYVDSSSNNVTISGFANGVADQILQVVRISSSNSVILQHNNSASQDLMLWGAANKTLSTIGGWTLVCDGTDWWEVSARAS